MPRRRRDPDEPRAVIGDNSLDPQALAAFVERVERLAEEQSALAEDIKEVYAEVKASGVDVKTLRRIVRLRRQDQDARRLEEERLAMYLEALGML